MRIASVLATAAIVVSCGSVTVQAQTSSKIVPAEFPPDSYEGRQYVDSEGCVFIRAGVDGNVTWVPRMTRDRKQICGAKPTRTAAASATRSDAEPKPQPENKPAATPTTTAESRPSPERRKPVAAPGAARPASYRRAPASMPAPAKPEAPAKTAAKPDSKRVVSSVCRGASPLSQKYINTSTGVQVRCGPQSAPHVTYKQRARTASAPVRSAPRASSAAPVRIAPKHVYEKQRASTRNMYLPEGYEQVWDDDRLNPKRTHQTFAGKAQMERVWTNTVPRRLIVRETGQVVSRNSSGLRSPSAGSAAQTAAADVSTRGTVQANSDQHPSVGGARTTRHAPQQRQERARVSTRSAPAEPERAGNRKAEPASHEYVQLGAFPDPDHALRAARRVANSGLPARMGDITRGGKDYKIVLAGPFDTQAQLTRGLQKVRGMGYSKAFLRK